MGINERLKFNQPFAWLGYCVIVFGVMLILMTLIVMMYLQAEQGARSSSLWLNSFYDKQEAYTLSIIEATWFFPFKDIWEFISSHALLGVKELGRVKIVVLSAVGVLLGTKLTDGYRRAKRESKALDKRVQQELDLEQRRREKGLSSDNTPLQSVKVSIVQKHDTADRKRFWDEKWWGKLVLLVIGAIILKLLHLK